MISWCRAEDSNAVPTPASSQETSIKSKMKKNKICFRECLCVCVWVPEYEIKFGCNLWKHGQTTNTSKPSFSISSGLLSIQAAQLASINNIIISYCFDNLIYSLLLFNICWIVLNNMFQSVWLNSLLGCCPPTMKCGHYVVPICDTLIAASQITASTEASKHLQREFHGSTVPRFHGSM